jgi:hypothetical protein
MPTGAHSSMARLGRVIGAYAEVDQPGATLRALDAVLAEAPGHLLFTILLHDPAFRQQERCYSSRPDMYPVGGASR